MIHLYSNKSFITLVTVLFLNTYLIGQTKFLNNKVPLFVADTGKYNPINNDNKIYTPRKTFVFSIEHRDSTQSLLTFCMKYNPNCKQDKSIVCLDWTIQKPQIDTTLYPITILKLYVFNGVGFDDNYSREQSIIRYDYCNVLGRVGAGELTGVIEDSARIFLHPPRQFGFIINELNPFPQVKFPLKKGNTWKRSLIFGKDYTKKLKIKYFQNIEQVIVNHTYTIEGETDLETIFGVIHCFLIRGKSDIYEWGNTQSDVYFSEKFGILKIINFNYDKSTTSYTLTSIEQ
jgi:hypothetical protein